MSTPTSPTPGHTPGDDSAAPTGRSTPGPTPTTAPGSGGGSGPGVGPGEQPRGGAAFWAYLRALQTPRSAQRWFGGVAGGLAARWGWDPLLVRGLFVAASLIGGIGFLAYAVCWALLPEPDGRIHAEEALKGRGDTAYVGIVIFTLLGLGPAGTLGPFGLWGLGTGEDGFSVFWRLVLIGIVIWAIVAHRRRRDAWRAAHPASAPPREAAPSGTAGSTEPAAPQAPPAEPGATTSAASGQTAGGWGSPEAPAPILDAQDAPAGAGDGSDGGAPPSWHGYTPPQPVATTPRPARPVRRGPGTAVIASVLGGILLLAAFTLLAGRVGALLHPELVFLGGSLVIVALGLIVTALRGRRVGLLTFLAIIGLVAGSSAAGGTFFTTTGWVDGETYGSAAVVPATIAEAEEGVAFNVGDLTLDLTQVPLPSSAALDSGAAASLTVPVDVSLGDVAILVPAEADVRIDAEVRAGEVRWEVGEGQSTRSGTSLSVTEQTAGVAEGAAPQIQIDLTLGAGVVRVIGVEE
ncbi:PspC domain-containing protein [Serinibacter salmoneus]|uniref:Phage shock protein C (PspC) family protein n=1 Tax=Serinibacter salmoneus TaxID=556530 RepID=A0A2A9CX56_9MICO|nr:PspC domain-containing protein [Serinibacter salmoneus]PFG19008.1 phage shock protein C (PspC) family protein [Serinibacter salmoneus]